MIASKRSSLLAECLFWGADLVAAMVRGETIPMHRRHMAYTFKVKVMKPKPRPSAKAHAAATLAPLDPAPDSVPGAGQSSGSAAPRVKSEQQGFRRQAQLP